MPESRHQPVAGCPSLLVGRRLATSPQPPAASHYPLNRYTVVVLYVFPGSSTVDGKLGWLTESGKCCVSRQNAACLLVRDAGAVLQAAVEEVAGVELQAGFRRQDLHRAAALRLHHPGGEGQRSATAAEHEVVVVADRRFDRHLLAMRAPMAVGVVKSKGVSFTALQLARRDERARPPGVNWSALIIRLVAQDVARPVARRG